MESSEQIAQRLRDALEAEDYALAAATVTQYSAALNAMSAQQGAKMKSIESGIELMHWALSMATSSRDRYRREYANLAHRPDYGNRQPASPRLLTEG